MKLNSAGIILSILMSSAVYASDSNYEKALTAFRQNQIDTAYIHLKNTLKDDPNSLPAKLLFADVLIAKNFYREAELELTEALDMGADVNLIVKPLTEALLNRGQFTRMLSLFDNYSLSRQSKYHYLLAQGKAQVGLGDYEGALYSYKIMSQQYPNDIEIQLGIVSVYLSTGQLKEAEASLSSLRSKSVDNAKITRYLGTLAFEKGDLSGALRHFKEANRLEPENVQSIRGMVNSYMSLQKFEEANRWVEQLISLTPHDPQARLLNSMVLRQMKDEVGANAILTTLTDQLSTLDQTFMLSQPQLLLIDAMASFGQKNWEQARNKFRVYIKNAEDKLDIRAVVLLADVYNALNQPKEALQLLTRYESELINHKDYALLLAGTYIKYDQKLDADNLLIQLRELYGADPGVLLMSAHLLSNRGQAQQAIEMLINANIPQSENYKHTLAALYLNAGDFESSLALSAELVSLASDNIEYRLLEVKSQIGLGLTAEAETNIRSLYESNKDSRDVQFEFARLMFNKGNLGEAKNELDRLVSQFPDSGLYRITLAEVDYSLGQYSSAVDHLERLSADFDYQKQAQHKLALIYLQHGQFNLSLDAANQILRLDRLDEDGLYVKARALTGLKNVELAKSQCDKLYGLWLDDAPQLLKLSKLQTQLSLLDDASKSLNQAIKLSPNNPQVLTALIKLDIRQNRLSDASTRINLMERDKRFERARVVVLKGDLARAQGNIEQAFEHYLQVLEEDKSNVVAFMSLNGLARNQGFPNKFAEVAEAVVNNHPDKPFYRTKLADHLMWMQSWQAAKHHYQILLTQKLPKREMALALNNLAVIHIGDNRLDQAIQMSQQALKLYPTVPAILDTAGWALTKSGQAQRGLGHLRQAYSMNSSDPEVLFHLAYTLTELNKVTEAKVMLNKLKTLPMDNKYRVEAELLVKQKGINL